MGLLRGRSPTANADQTFPEHLDRGVREALSEAANDPTDIYVVSLLVQDEEDDPMRPTLTVGWNTETRVEFALTASPEHRLNPWWIPADEAEARWNYAFWLQNGSQIGDSRTDEFGCALRTSWLTTQRMAAGGTTHRRRGLRRFINVGEQATQLFVDLCVEEAQRLHQDGTIASVFGRPIPVLVHELEYYDAIAAQARAANPSGLADEFIAWVESSA